MESLFRKIPFSIAGAAVFVISLVILVHSLYARNVYEIFLSMAALFFLLVLGIMGEWAKQKLKTAEIIWKPPPFLSASSTEEWQIDSPPVKIPLFYRLHFLLRGKFHPQGEHSLKSGVFAQTSFQRGRTRAGLGISFPVGGLFFGEGSTRLRDVFGLFSFYCGKDSFLAVKIMGSPCYAKALRINTVSGSEDRRSRQSSDEERYYMREYAAGDRLRDINWKSSERLDALITRISPLNQEKVSRIEIYFRNYGPLKPGIGELWLLDRLKARLSWFIRNIKDENDNFVFDVYSGSSYWELVDRESIDAFFLELSAISFCREQGGQSPIYAGANKQGELFVFSCACDAGLQAFINSHNDRSINLFLAADGNGDGIADDGEGSSGNQAAILKLGQFPEWGIIPLSAGFLYGRKNPVNVSIPGMLIDYASVKL